MRNRHHPSRINVKALVILVLVTALLGGGAVVGHYVRKRVTAERALTAGEVALEKGDGAEACKQLKLYLSKYPDDEEILARYAEANLAVRPVERRHVAAAISAYRRLLRSRPDDAQIYTQLAKLYYRIGDYAECAYVCRQRLEADQDDADTMLWLGRALGAQRRDEEAADVMVTLVERHPDQVKAYALLAQLAMREDSVSAGETALSWLNRAVAANPESAEARAQRGRFHRLRNNNEILAREDLEAADALHPTDPTVLLALAGEWMEWRELDRAAIELQRLERIDQATLETYDVDADMAALARFTTAGKLALLRGATEDGVALADRALQQLPEHRRSAFMPTAVDLYLAGGRVDEARAAVEAYRNAIPAVSDTSASTTELLALLDATVAEAEGKPYAVINLLETFVAGKPQIPRGWKLLGRAYEKTGQARRALAAYEEYMARVPDAEELVSLRDTNPEVGRIRILLAGIAADKGRVDDAIAQLESAVDEDSAIPRILLAELYAASDRKEEARRALQEAVADLTGREQLKARIALAQFILLHGVREEGLALLQELAREHPRNVQLRAGLLTLPEVQKDTQESQRLIDELKSVEGERGLLWRVEQAKLWLRGDCGTDFPVGQRWKTRQRQIEDMLNHCIRSDPGWSEPALALGRMYEMLGQDSEAERTYRLAVTSDSSQVDVVVRLLTLLERQQQFAKAAAILDGMPENLSALSAHRIDVAIGLGDYESAIAELERRVVADPEDAALRVALATLVYTHEKGVDRAMKRLDEAEAISPELPAVVAGRVSILRAEGRSDEALALLDAEVSQRNDFTAHLMRAEFYAAAGKLDLAEKDYTHLTTFTERAAKGYAALGRFYRKSGKLDEAIAAWEAGLGIEPDDLDLQRMLAKTLVVSHQPQARDRGREMLDDLLRRFPDNSELLSIRAAALLAENTSAATHEAAAVLEHVVELDPRNVTAWLQLIELAGKRGDLRQTDELATRALGANPSDLRLILARAGVEADSGNVRVARELAESVLETDPSNVPARNLLARLALRVGKIDRARALFEEVIAQQPANITAHLELARVAHQADQFDAAEQAYRRILALEPHHWQTLNDLAWVLALSGGEDGLKEAKRLVDKGVARHPDNVHLLDTRGVVLFKLGRLEEARKDLEKCIGLAETQHVTRAKALLHLAHVLVEMGNEADAARSNLENAQRIDETHHVLSDEERTEVAQLLESL